MSGCGNPDCGCKDKCTCAGNCKCGSRSMNTPNIGGLRNYVSEPDCKCGPDCANCANCDCDCHK